MDEKKESGAAGAPGQQKSYTLTHPDGRPPLTLTQAEIRAQRKQLKADGWTGHGLDEDDVTTEGTIPTGDNGE